MHRVLHTLLTTVTRSRIVTPVRDSGESTKQETRMADRLEIAKRVRMALGAGAFRSRDDAAAKISAELGYHISREILRKTEEGLRGAEIELLDAIATVCGVEREFVRGDTYVFVPNDVRALNRGKGAYLPSTRDSRTYLRSAIDHELGGCVACLLDPNAHVQAEWLRTEVPGQTELVIEIDHLREAV
jgi:hypothetical protein